MSWHAQLTLHYTRDGERCIAHDRHVGPLRVLQRLYPEGPAVCHHVLVHPPGGIVGGDVLELDARLDAHTHALITTPGATRFYRSGGNGARQRVAARVADGARLEWLPLETIAYNGALAENQLGFDLAPGAEMIGWDVVALGLPAAGEAFERGRYAHELRLARVWLERATIDASDHRLLDSPLGLAGKRVLATLWFAAGSALGSARREALLDAARSACHDSPLKATAGATAPHAEVVVLRALADRVEPAMQLFTQVWSAWRHAAWHVPPCAPRVWHT